MNGILVVDKPKNCTSRDAVNFICKKFNTKKVGHTGTLDPMATGVLIVLIGKYTSLVEVITSYDKTYEAEITLGTLTDTLDITGNIIEEERVNITKSEIEKTLIKMTKTYEQEVPIYSAVKVNGKKLYEYARNGENIVLPKRTVCIKKLELISDITSESGKIKFKIKASVSKGTYIRALINDIAKSLGTIGIMSDLRRIKQGNIDIKRAYSLEEINSDKFNFYDINDCLSDIFSVEVDDEKYKMIKNGVRLENTYDEDIVLFKYHKIPIAIYKSEEKYLKMWKYLI